jgi:hypothetical protein
MMSDSEIDAVNQRIPDLVAVEAPVEELADENDDEDEDQNASASGG